MLEYLHNYFMLLFFSVKEVKYYFYSSKLGKNEIQKRLISRRFCHYCPISELSGDESLVSLPTGVVLVPYPGFISSQEHGWSRRWAVPWLSGWGWRWACLHQTCRSVSCPCHEPCLGCSAFALWNSGSHLWSWSKSSLQPWPPAVKFALLDSILENHWSLARWWGWLFWLEFVSYPVSSTHWK